MGFIRRRREPSNRNINSTKKIYSSKQLWPYIRAKDLLNTTLYINHPDVALSKWRLYRLSNYEGAGFFVLTEFVTDSKCPRFSPFLIEGNIRRDVPAKTPSDDVVHCAHLPRQKTSYSHPKEQGNIYSFHVLNYLNFGCFR